MRDKNLTLLKFNIQLDRTIASHLRDDKLLSTAVSDSPKCLNDNLVSIVYPRDFSGLRALAIVQWSFPENLHWRILLDLREKDHNQLNEKQKLELSLLLSSKDLCYFFLYETERYSSREIFGNILGNQLKDLLKTLKIKEKIQKKPKKAIRHRGYRDKGSRRPDHQWIECFDLSFNEYQLKIEKKRYLLDKNSNKLLQLLTEKLRTHKELETRSSE
jgi:hypothetical protein